MQPKYAIAAIAGLFALGVSTAPAGHAQQQAALNATLDKDEQAQVLQILDSAHSEVKKNYYDPKLQGVDWDARYQHYKEMVPKAHNLGEGFRVVAAFLSGLKDSHVFFMPPERANHFDSGYRVGLVGNDAYITQIRPKSDAESKLHIGDLIVKQDGYNVNRDDFMDLRYYYGTLAPRQTVQLIVRAPGGQDRTVAVTSRIKVESSKPDTAETQDYWNKVREMEGENHTTRSRMVERGDVAIWKLQRFDPDDSHVDRNIGIARKHKALILDLRGNPGGAIETLKEIVGSLFEKDIKIADRVARKENKPMLAKHQGSPFTGKLIVLVDAGSASCAELLARTVQLEHRATVVGDRTAGAVMEARDYVEEQGAGFVFVYAFSITEANLIMTDGKSLEKTGVTPDELLLPTGADLAAGRDPVLAHAAELAGVKIDAAEAGKLFPFEWPPQ